MTTRILRNRAIRLVITTAMPLLAAAQDTASVVSFGGYLHNMQSLVSIPPEQHNLLLDNTLHNRINFTWYPVEVFELHAGVRTRLMVGETVKRMPANYQTGDKYLSWNWLTDTACVANTTLDRLYATLHFGQWQITLGRQRINWGQTYVWNPNDLFNTYSYFDVDYTERQGSDALRLSWYPSGTSQLDVAAKVNNRGLATVAACYRVNVWQTDIQVLAGIADEHDYALGTGWSTQVGGTGIKGEATCFWPVANAADTIGVLLITTGADYRCDNGLYLQAEVLYNSTNTQSLPEGLLTYYNTPAGAKNLSLAQWNLFGQVSWPATPLLQTRLAAMYLPDAAAFLLARLGVFPVR